MLSFLKKKFLAKLPSRDSRHSNEEKLDITSIHDLPEEVLLLIFRNLSLHEIVKCSKICQSWREIIAQGILRPELLKYANANEQLEIDFTERGWTRECQDTDLILFLYRKYHSYECKYHKTSYNRCPKIQATLEYKKH